MNTQPSGAAAGEHFADAERALAALPLVKRGERDRHVQVALVHAVLAVAAACSANGRRRPGRRTRVRTEASDWSHARPRGTPLASRLAPTGGALRCTSVTPNHPTALRRVVVGEPFRRT
jgi:hypothetical protein